MNEQQKIVGELFEALSWLEDIRNELSENHDTFGDDVTQALTLLSHAIESVRKTTVILPSEYYS